MNEVFIVGAPRSGTTLLQSILATHSEFFSVPETSFFSRILGRLGAGYYSPDHPLNDRDVEIIKQDLQLMTGFQIPSTSQICAGMSVKAAFEALLLGFNTGRKPRWLEKTTAHAKCMLAIRRFYPDAKFLHIIRDPVDCVASMINIMPTSLLDLRIRYFSSYYDHARLWNESVTDVLLYPDQTNVLHIFYEQLVMKPKTVIEEVCRFLQIRFEGVLLESFHQTAATLLSADSCPWQTDNLSPGFHANAVHKWRGRLSPYRVWLIQRYTENLCRYIGYYEDVEVRSGLLKLFYLAADQTRRFFALSGFEASLRKLLGRIMK
jgi:hypothetical protein